MADAFAITNDGSGGAKTLQKRFAACSFNYVALDNGFELTFNNCTDDYGITRNGTIRVTASPDAFSSDNAGSITIEFINYSTEGYGISGTITASYQTGTLGFWFEIAANNLKIDYPDGTSVIYNTASLQYVFSAANKFELEISGSSDGINRNGQHFSTQTENVKINFLSSDGCPYPSEGTMTIEIEGENTMTLDFDSGTCGEIEVSQKGHKKATITIF